MKSIVYINDRIQSKENTLDQLSHDINDKFVFGKKIVMQN